MPNARPIHPGDLVVINSSQSQRVAVLQILEAVQGLERQGWTYTLSASFIEVYNESLRDLLASTGPGDRAVAKTLDANAIQHQPGGTHVHYQTQRPFSTHTHTVQKSCHGLLCLPLNHHVVCTCV